MTEVPITIAETQALVDRLHDALVERDLPYGRVQLKLEGHVPPEFYAKASDGMNSPFEFASLTPEGVAKIEAFIAAQPTGRMKAEAEAIKALAAAIEAARKAEWPEDWIVSTQAQLQAATENLLTYQPEASA